MRQRTEGHIVEQRAGGVPVQHDRLTALEQKLLRIFYTVVIGWYSEDLDELLRELKRDGDIDDAEAALLEQLLEEERADRQ